MRAGDRAEAEGGGAQIMAPRAGDRGQIMTPRAQGPWLRDVAEGMAEPRARSSQGDQDAAQTRQDAEAPGGGGSQETRPGAEGLEY